MKELWKTQEQKDRRIVEQHLKEQLLGMVTNLRMVTKTVLRVARLNLKLSLAGGR